MSSAIIIDNKKYISVKEASLLTSYSKDYIGQLCRSNKIESKRIGRVWYVTEESILNYKDSSLVIEDRKYISAKQASSLTGYSKEYIISHLCRSNKVESKKIGRAHV